MDSVSWDKRVFGSMCKCTTRLRLGLNFEFMCLTMVDIAMGLRVKFWLIIWSVIKGWNWLDGTCWIENRNWSRLLLLEFKEIKRFILNKYSNFTFELSCSITKKITIICSLLCFSNPSLSRKINTDNSIITWNMDINTLPTLKLYLEEC